jgi:hypothetical protein
VCFQWDEKGHYLTREVLTANRLLSFRKKTISGTNLQWNQLKKICIHPHFFLVVTADREAVYFSDCGFLWLCQSLQVSF